MLVKPTEEGEGTIVVLSDGIEVEFPVNRLSELCRAVLLGTKE
ncbi:hypothetical protein [Bacillus thermotolerans]|nr:hypothetical protein [Bacillus thermotolerans]